MVVDDHPMWRDAVERDLQGAGFDVVGVAANGSEALARFPACRPHVVVLDLQIPPPNGVEVTAEVLRQDPSARVLILSASGEQEDVLEAVKAGATGYLLKSSLRTEMLDAIHNVHHGRRHVHHDVATEIALHVVDDSLSDREVEVLRLVAVGKANKEIARAISLSEETVKAHLKSIFAKLDVADRTHAVTVAARRGIIEL